ncbi:hypothetical protein QTP88_008862 [Uroleucon formosanum]
MAAVSQTSVDVYVDQLIYYTLFLYKNKYKKYYTINTKTVNENFFFTSVDFAVDKSPTKTMFFYFLYFAPTRSTTRTRIFRQEPAAVANPKLSPATVVYLNGASGSAALETILYSSAVVIASAVVSGTFCTEECTGTA